MEKSIVVREDNFKDCEEVLLTSDANLVAMTTPFADKLLHCYLKKVARGKKASAVNVEQAEKLQARILALTVGKDTVKSIQKKLSNGVSKATIYRAISVSKFEDRERILRLFHKYPQQFNDLTEVILIRWFEVKRIQKLHLWSESELIARFGKKVYENMRKLGLQKDIGVKIDTYYSVEDVLEYAKKAKLFDETESKQLGGK